MIYGYSRVSTVEQAEKGVSIAGQQRVVGGIAQILNEPVRFYDDAGVSGSIPFADRPGGARITELLQKGDTIVVSKLDRAFRSAEDALSTSRRWSEAGVDLIIADMGTTPVTANGVGKLFFGMLALVAEFERERITERLTEGRRAKARKGGFIGGRPPFGFTVEGKGVDAVLVPVPHEQDVILSIVSQRKGQNSLRAIARAIRASHGYVLSHETVRAILEREEAK